MAKPNTRQHPGEDPLLMALMFECFDLTASLAHGARDRIRHALLPEEIERVRSDNEIWTEFVKRQARRQLLLAASYRDPSGDFKNPADAAELAEAIRYQLELAEKMDDKSLARLVNLVRRHGLAGREIALALGRDHRSVIDDLRAAFVELTNLDSLESDED